MKFGFLFFLLVTLFASATSRGQVSIRGKILEYDGKSLVYYHPTVEGIYTPYWKEVKPARNGSFRIEYENAGYGNIRISYKSIVYRFFHDSDSKIYLELKEKEKRAPKRIPGKKIFIVTDSIKQATTVEISGDYQNINRFYNRNLRSSYFTTQMVDGSYYSHLVSSALTPSSAMAIIDSLAQIEIKQIDQLPWRINFEKPTIQKKDEEIREFLINEVHAFYGAIFLNGMFLKRKEHVIKLMTDSTAAPDIYNRSWEVLIEDFTAQMKKNLNPAPNSADYMDFMESWAHTLSSYKQYDFPQDPTVTLDEMVTARLFNYDTTLFKDEKSRFAYELSGLQLYLNDQLFFSPGLLHAVYELQAKYPNSANLEFYTPHIEKLKASLAASLQPFGKAKIIGVSFKSFDDLIRRFEGKNILVDIWATWCHPCIADFKYKSALLPFVEAGQMELLYISIDKRQWADRWRQSIKINALAGNHFRADPEFIKDMWETIGDYQGAIPRYVLIDRQGRIFKSTAARPGQDSELVEQIRTLVDGN